MRALRSAYPATVLEPRTSDDVLARAAAANQTEWFARHALVAGGVVHRERGSTWMASRAGAVLAFPSLSHERLRGLLPQILSAARRRSHQASCWSLLPTEPEELGDELAAAGFREGWQAHWMAREIDVSPVPYPDGVEIGLASAQWGPSDLPWDGPEATELRRLLVAERPRRVWQLAAWRDGVPVGHVVVNVTTGRLGVAGIYDMGVAPHERRRGIGRALTLAALQLGRAQGCSVATLNATEEGELLYRTIGFRPVGVAQTWWLDLARG